MSKKLRAQRVLPAMMAGVLLAAAAGPATVAAIYCKQMGASLAHPCCEKAQVQQNAPSPAEQISEQPCCTSIRLALEKPAGEKASHDVRPLAPVMEVGQTLDEGAQTGFALGFGHLAVVDSDAGPPIYRRTCSLLI
jgi:hypothetical protein